VGGFGLVILAHDGRELLVSSGRVHGRALSIAVGPGGPWPAKEIDRNRSPRRLNWRVWSFV
jgi:hypothetical protein